MPEFKVCAVAVQAAEVLPVAGAPEGALPASPNGASP
jgi:hypothetical protein